jgi:hypothetical protein
MPEVADLYTVLRAETAPFTRGLRPPREGESFTSPHGRPPPVLVKIGAATTLVGVGFAAYGVKAAGDFQQQMNLLVTACGESQSKLKQVSDGVLSLARQTGTSTGELADGMYQVEKAGYRAGDGLKVLKAAAQGAREEGASLKDVTNAMTSVMASYHLEGHRLGPRHERPQDRGRRGQNDDGGVLPGPVHGHPHRLRQQDQLR